MHDIDSVFNILIKNNIKVSVSKCEFNVEFLHFLGYNINASSIKPTAKKNQ